MKSVFEFVLFDSNDVMRESLVCSTGGKGERVLTSTLTNCGS